MPLLKSRAWPRRANRSGFTLIEAVMVLLIVATVVGALTPAVIRTISHARVNRAASAVAADFFLSQSLAGRQHSPVIVAFDSTNRQTTISLPSPPGTVLLTRRFGIDSEFKLIQYTSTSPSVIVLPNAMVSTTVTVTLGDGTYTKRVKMTRAGFVRIL